MDVIFISFDNDTIDITRLGHLVHKDHEGGLGSDLPSDSPEGGVAASGLLHLQHDPFRSARHYLLQKEVKLLLCHFFLGAILISFSLRRHLGASAEVNSLANIVLRFMMDSILLDCLLQEEQRPDAGRRRPESFFRVAFLMVFSLVSRKAIRATTDLDLSPSLWGSLVSTLQYVLDMD